MNNSEEAACYSRQTFPVGGTKHVTLDVDLNVHYAYPTDNAAT